MHNQWLSALVAPLNQATVRDVTSLNSLDHLITYLPAPARYPSMIQIKNGYCLICAIETNWIFRLPPLGRHVCIYSEDQIVYIGSLNRIEYDDHFVAKVTIVSSRTPTTEKKRKMSSLPTATIVHLINADFITILASKAEVRECKGEPPIAAMIRILENCSLGPEMVYGQVISNNRRLAVPALVPGEVGHIVTQIFPNRCQGAIEKLPPLFCIETILQGIYCSLLLLNPPLGENHVRS